MQIFGQVWLWSLGSFLLGVLFTWLLLVKPARSRVVELEEAATRPPREPRQPTRVAEPVGPPTGREADRFLDDLFDTPKAPSAPPQATVQQPPVHQPAVHQTAVQQSPVLPPPVPKLPPPPMPTSAQPGPTAPPEVPPLPEPVATPQTQAFSSRLDPTAPPEPPIPDESETELSDNPFRQFTESTTVFVPPADLRIPDKVEPSGEDWFAKEEEPDPHLITDVEDDEQVDERGTIFTQRTTPISDDVIRTLDNEPPPEQVQPYQPQAAEPAQHEEKPDLTQRFELASEPPEAEDSSRSLFEPVVPVPEQDGAESSESDDFVPPGPFGPGSAMPLPGGGAPAPEFNVKASVTALRYCTQDNPQFDRIVAEVWFRSPSDAERVGFRVLS